MTEPNLQTITEIVQNILINAGNMLRDAKDIEFSFKKEVKEVPDVGSAVVTNLDLMLQNFILEQLIEAEYFDFSVLGEEEELLDNEKSSPIRKFNKNSPYCWVIDPIDGTLNYLSGVPKFREYAENRFGKELFDRYYTLSQKNAAIVIGLRKDSEFLMGMLYFPFSETLYYAIKEGGAYKNGLRFFQEKSEDSEKGDDSKNEKEVGIIKTNSGLYRKLMWYDHRIQKAQGASCSLMELAEKGDFTYAVKNAWLFDFGPQSLVIEEAGGFVSDDKGLPLNFSKEKLVYAIAGTSRESNMIAARLIESFVLQY